MSDDRRVVPLFPQQQADVERLLAEFDRLNTGGGDGTSGGVTEDWKADVERRLGQLHDDVRALLNRGVIAVVALAGMVAGLYLYTNVKFEALDRRLAVIETQQARDNAVVAGKLDVILERTQSGRK